MLFGRRAPIIRRMPLAKGIQRAIVFGASAFPYFLLPACSQCGIIVASAQWKIICVQGIVTGREQYG